MGLLRLSAWLNKRGDKWQYFDNKIPDSRFDEIWITTLFTYDIPYVQKLIQKAKTKCKRVRVGGISATLMPEQFRHLNIDLHDGLVVEAERLPMCYDLIQQSPRLKAIPSYSVTFTQRGCVRKCEYCAVRIIEPKYTDNPDWLRDIRHDTKQVRIVDNNWLAKPMKLLKRDAEILHRIVADPTYKCSACRPYEGFDFCSGFDCRLMTEEKAKLLQGLPLYPIRFAFDHMGEDGHWQNAVELMCKYGQHYFHSYIMYNHDDTPEDLYYRMREHVRMSMVMTQKYGRPKKNSHVVDFKITGFFMRYHPLFEIRINRNYAGPNYTIQLIKNFRYMVKSISPLGNLSLKGSTTMTPLDEFEFWFGKDEKQFMKMLHYPKLKQLMDAKKGKMRMLHRKEPKLRRKRIGGELVYA